MQIRDDDLKSFAKVVNGLDVSVQLELFIDIFNNKDYTLLVPPAKKWNDALWLNIPTDEKRVIIKMHVIKAKKGVKITEKIIKDAISGGYAKLPSLSGYSNLYFDGKENSQLHVIGCGVNAIIELPDQKEGNIFFHRIDEILCLPNETVYEKLYREPTYNYTKTLGENGHFNEQLRNTKRKFTFFLVRDYTWGEIGKKRPEVVKKFLMPLFAIHAQHLLERHLGVSNKAYTMEEMVLMSLDSEGAMELPKGDKFLYFRVEKSKIEYRFLWSSENIEVYMPDIKCTNGIIHVLEFPMIQGEDVGFAGGLITTPSINNKFYMMFITSSLFIIRMWGF
uniref:FAS1 domain-containing protein n=1 Tax=Glossina brevipalpis TaxID=37001 RepID=A0A1A9WMU8_9MUSC